MLLQLAGGSSANPVGPLPRSPRRHYLNTTRKYRRTRGYHGDIERALIPSR
jgi:hypothetical protein